MRFITSNTPVPVMKMGIEIRVFGATMLFAVAVARGLAATHYVDLNSANPTPPYTNWAMAATVIQDAVDAADTGDDVVVTNGIYAEGGRTVGTNALVNRVAVDKPLMLRSVNGPSFTAIRGYQLPTNIIGDGAIRCVYLESGAALSGFSLTNGGTRYFYSSPPSPDSIGAGVWCASPRSVVSNCVISGNTAYIYGGGARGGTLRNCTLSGNMGWGWGGAGAYESVLDDCTLSGNSTSGNGGGAEMCALTNCMLSGNSAGSGGGANDSALVGCSLTDNSASYGGGASESTLNHCTVTLNQASSQGGGVADCVVNNSTVSGNSAGEGGGAYQSTFKNSLISDNSAVDSLRYDYSSGYEIYSAGPGGGASQCILTNCTLTGNTVVGVGGWGGGVAGCQLYNSIAFYNIADTKVNFDAASSLSYCCTTPLPAIGPGNISDAPQLASASHLSLLSPCIGAGLTAFTSGTDIDGEPWADLPSIGCDELHLTSVTGALSCQITANFTNVTVGFAVSLSANIEGRTLLSAWEFGDGATELDQPFTSHAWSAPGNYQVTLWVFNETHPDGISVTQLIHVGQSIIYVASGNLNPQAPYMSWATAATNLQDAVNVSPAGGTVLVTNGVYASGSQTDASAVTNRMLVDRPLTVRSVNGPQATVIDGAGTVRCVSLGENAVISGFTLTNGVAGTVGGGAWCAGRSSVLSNCMINGNSARLGGGVYGGTVDSCILIGNTAGSGGGTADAASSNCTLSGNSASDAYYYYFPGPRGGAVYGGTLTKCTLSGNSVVTYTGEADGGGAYGAMLNDCTLTNNSATSYNGGFAYGQAASGGGASSCSLSRCFLSGNSAVTWWQGDYGWYEFDGDGGGAASSTLSQSTVSGNFGPAVSSSTLGSCALTGNANLGASGSTLNHCTVTLNAGGGVSGCFVTNSIIYFNGLANYESSSKLNYCCTTPQPAGNANISADPQLADPSHLSSGSPCRGAGSAVSVGRDIDGDPWLEPPSIGCDEPYDGIVTGPLTLGVASTFTNVAVGFPVGLVASVSGRASSNVWNFGDGVTLSDELTTSHTWLAPGDYPVVFTVFNDSFPGGTNASVTIHVVTQPIHYVAAGTHVSVTPYASWATAATNIQDAVDAATVPGALVLVTNGTYATGGRPLGFYEYIVVVEKPLALRSANGPQHTMIRGGTYAACVGLSAGAILSGFTVTNGSGGNGGGVWCNSTSEVVSNCLIVANSGYLGGGAYQGTLNNCTLAGNSGGTGGGAYRSVLNHCTLNRNWANNGYGGGAERCLLNNCMVSSNSATQDYASRGGGASDSVASGCTFNGNSARFGGGASDSILVGCSLSGNRASEPSQSAGGGVYNSTLNNCTLTANSAVGYRASGGGAVSSTMNNCIIWLNQAFRDGNYGTNCTLNYCCTTPLPQSGTGNIAEDPQLASASHLSAVSRCRGAGNPAAETGTDIDGELWAAPPSMGCDEVHAGAVTGPLTVTILPAFTNIAAGFSASLVAAIDGRITHSVWDFGDGTSITNQPYTTHAWAVPGNYSLTLTACNETLTNGSSASVPIQVIVRPVHYVSPASANPVSPYSSWATAARQIQDAVNAAAPGGVVKVTNGTYASGSVAVGIDNLPNRVAVDKPVVVQSMNGPSFTTIQGHVVPGTTNGVGAVRCVYVASGAALSGFTLTGGATLTSGDFTQDRSGGGVWCESATSLLSNCVVTGNFADATGAGVRGGTINASALTRNAIVPYGYNDFCAGGGACYSTLSNCVLTGNQAGVAAFTVGQGGGVAYAQVMNCTFSSNSAAIGGAVAHANLSNCALYANSAYYSGGDAGGGAWYCSLLGCTMANNRATGSYSAGGGVVSSSLTNCILYFNTAVLNGADYSGDCAFDSCCTLAGIGRSGITNAPLFLDLAGGNLRLQSNSPCINAGNNAYAPSGPDLDANPRIAGGTVDIGAYEFQNPGSAISYAWLQHHGLPMDGSADFTDPDSDRMNNWQEWRCGTDPTSALSALRLLSPTVSKTNVLVTWQSVAGVSYFLERASNLASPEAFTPLATNIVGQSGTTTYADTNATSGPFFYRVGVGN